MGLEWGEHYPVEAVDVYGWTEWKLEDGSAPTFNPPIGMGVSVADWGKLILYPSELVYSSVKSMPSGTRTVEVEKNRYGFCVGNVDVWIRGSSTTFDWDDGSPSWSLYTSPVSVDWSYVQLRVGGDFGATTTTTTV